jgi:subtilisin family serine protease
MSKHYQSGWRCALVIAVLALVLGACQPSAAPTATSAPSGATVTPEGATPAPEGTQEVSVVPVDATPEATRPVAGGRPEGSDNTIGGTPIGQPSFEAPETFEDLLAQNPELQTLMDQIAGTELADIDFSALYQEISTLYTEQGASAVATYLEESGILERLNIPFSYLDLLREYEQGGLEAVETLARERDIISENDELIAYLAVSEANLAEVSLGLTGLGVSVYEYNANTEEVQIGIPLEVIAQYQTPGALLNYLVSIANIPGVEGYRVPEPRTLGQADTEMSVAGDYIGADDWQAAGFTGEGVRIGVLDMGFGDVADLVEDGQLPEGMESNYPLDEMNDMREVHGTACALVIHRIAPDAELVLAYYDGSYSGFLEALEFLADQNVNIVSNSTGSSLGPRDGTFGDAPLVDEFVERTGALWVNSAGNSAESYTAWEFEEGDDNLHNFGTDGDPVYYLPFMAGEPYTSIVMNWDGDWDGGEENNYHLTIWDEDGDEVAVFADSRRGRRNDYPVQGGIAELEPGTVYFMTVERVRGDGDNVFEIFVNNGLFPDWALLPGGQVISPGDAASSFTVGATGLTEDELESYSSRGPTTDNRIKPDIVAPTGEIVDVYPDGFFGTSGAAPAVAGAAALVWQRFPDMSNEEVKAFLMENAVDLGENGEDPEFGAGRLNLPAPDGSSEQQEPESDEVVANFDDVDIEYDARRRGNDGMRVTLSFELENFEGREVWAALVFFDEDGEPLEVDDSDYMMGSIAGVGESVRVRSGRSSFEDVVLFFPYEAFGRVREGTVYSFVVAILDLSGDETQILGQTEAESIEFR